MSQEFVQVTSMVGECQCDDCKNEAPECWHWNFTISDNGRTLTIYDRENTENARYIEFPPDIVVMKVIQVSDAPPAL